MTEHRGIKIAIVIAVACLLTPCISIAQSVLIEHGQNAVGIRGYLATNEVATGFGGILSYSAYGRLDLQGTVSKASSTEQNIDVDAIGLEAAGSIHMLKQEANIPVGIALNFGYGKIEFSGDALDELQWDMTGTAYGFGGSVTHKAETNGATSVILDYTIGYSFSDFEVRDRFGNVENLEGQGVGHRVSATLAIKSRKHEFFTVTPSVSFGGESETTFRIAMGVVFVVK